MQVQEAAAISGVTAIPWDRFTAGARVPQGPNDELVVWLGKLNQKMETLEQVRLRVHTKKSHDMNKPVLARYSFIIGIHEMSG